MHLPIKTVTIDGVEYEITTLDAIKARRIWVRLVKALGPGIEAAAASDAPQEAGLKLLGATLERLPDDLLGEIADVFGESCTVSLEGRKPTVASVARFHFAGRPLHWSKWLLECAKVNFADFLDATGGTSVHSLADRFLSKSPKT